jgi:hypothetical protein
MFGLIENGKVGGLIVYAEHSISPGAGHFMTKVLIGGADPQILPQPTISSRSSKKAKALGRTAVA